MAGWKSQRTWHLIQRGQFGDSGESHSLERGGCEAGGSAPEEMLDKEIYYDEGVGGKWSFHFPGNVMQIYPGKCNWAWK